MTRVVYGLALFLLLVGVMAGVLAIANLRMEQGSLELVSASVLVSAGCVMVALGTILARLDQAAPLYETEPVAPVRETVAPAAGRPLTPLEIFGSPTHQEEVEASFSDGHTTPGAARAAPEPAIEEVTHAGHEPAMPEPGPDLDLEKAISEELAKPAPPLPPNEPAFVLDLPPVRPRPSLLSGLFRKKPNEADVETATVEDLSPAPSIAPHLDHEKADLPAPSVEHEPEHAEFGGDAPPLAHDFHTEPEEAEFERLETSENHAAHEGHEAEEIHEAPETAAALDHPLRPAGPAAPSVVGRYNAGSASYVMYSNGMIEVETEAGVHQFQSMQELKAFIERQDAARVAGEVP